MEPLRKLNFGGVLLNVDSFKRLLFGLYEFIQSVNYLVLLFLTHQEFHFMRINRKVRNLIDLLHSFEICLFSI